MKRLIKAGILFGIFLICLFVLSSQVNAETIHLDAATLAKGYTITNQDSTIKLGIFPNSILGPLDVVFKQKDEIISQIGSPQGMVATSPLYEFDLKSQVELEFKEPLVLQLNYDSNTFFKKHVFFWDARRSTWIEMPYQDFPEDGFVRTYIHLPYAILAVFEERVANKSVVVDQETINKGYTIEHRNSEIKIGIMAESISQPVRVVLKWQKEAPVDPETDLISNVYSFDLLSSQLVEVKKPIYVSLKYFKDNGGEKTIKYWDDNRNAWQALPTSIDSTQMTARAKIQLAYAKVAVFENNQEINLGIASYFRAKSPDGCAYLDYPFGTKLKVTNLENDQTTIVVVEDRGPFIFGRIIDLSIESFKKLASLSQGLIRVRVEKID